MKDPCQLKPTKLHELAATPVWTDALWDEAREFVLARTVTEDAILMHDAVFEPGTVRSLYKIDFLAPFRHVPPTVLLGAFDMMRLMRVSRR